MGRNDMVSIACNILRETALAILINDGDESVWLPKSKIEYDENAVDSDKVTTVEVPEWLAEDKGLI